jgi:hypothetical protein
MNVMLNRQLISIVSAAMLAVHVSMGCCADPQHGYAGAADSMRLVEQRGSDQSMPQHEPQPGDPHCGVDRCAFLTTSKTCVPELSSAWAIAPITGAAELAGIGQQAAVQTAPARVPFATPVRIHLAKQVFLI